MESSFYHWTTTSVGKITVLIVIFRNSAPFAAGVIVPEIALKRAELRKNIMRKVVFL
jgi:hypothetical protein